MRLHFLFLRRQFRQPDRVLFRFLASSPWAPGLPWVAITSSASALPTPVMQVVYHPRSERHVICGGRESTETAPSGIPFPERAGESEEKRGAKTLGNPVGHVARGLHLDSRRLEAVDPWGWMVHVSLRRIAGLLIHPSFLTSC